MRTQNMMRHLAWGVLGLVSQQAFTQVTVPNNNGQAGAFVGWNSGANQILDVKNEGDQPIDFYTSDRFRARINQGVQYDINGFLNIPADGFTLITPDMGFLNQPPKGPFSRLHLAEGGESGNAEQWGYRPWQRNGVTFTGNTDQGYVGQKYRHGGGTGETDMVMQWSDNPGNWKGDRLRFIFTGGYNATDPIGRKSLEGEEGMRLYPTVDKGINVGIGDFFAGNYLDPANVTDPTERLDVLDGRVRIRKLPTDPEANTLDQYMVVDHDGVVNWRHLPVTPPPAPSCEWSLNPTSHNNVSTAFGPFDPDCPDGTDAVGVGMDLGAGVAPAKLNVSSYSNTYTTGIDVNINNLGNASGATLDVTGADHSVRGVQANTHGTSYVARAGDFISYDTSPYATGVYGQVFSGTGSSEGVHGISYSNGTWNSGVMGESKSHGLVNAGLFGTHGTGYIPPAPNGNHGIFAATQIFNLNTDRAG